jgi:cell division protein FtsI (penicillin-binding protein 3)
MSPVYIPLEGSIGGSRGPALPESAAQPSSMIVTVDGAARQMLEQARTRLLVVGALFTLALLVVAARLADLAIVGAIGGGAQAHSAPAPQRIVRADIVDRNGRVLATSIATASLFADPAKIIDAPDAARQLSALFPDTSYGEFLEKLEGRGRFAWLHRHLTPAQQYQVRQLGIPGVDFQPDERRLYPEGSEIAQVIGYADIDNHGIAGIEQSFDDYLARGSAPIALSIDIRLQHILHQEVQAQVDEFQAKGGGGLIMDTRTGEILAMVSLPDFDPEQPAAISPKLDPDDPDPRFNRMTLGVYEMGSIFKVFNTALALDSGRVSLNDYFDATHPLKIARFTIDDDRGDELRKWASVAEIFEKSSNIGSVQMVKQVGPELQEQFMDRLGLTRKPKLEVPEIGIPHYPHPWRPINMMTIAFGHGISVSPVQLVSAVSAVADGGILRPATLLKRPDDSPAPGTRVISPQTSEIMRRLMRLVVTGGTGKKYANVPGYLVGGKTGTAEKVGLHGGYKKKHGNLSSFVGMFPMTDPRYAVFVTIDEPHGNKKSFGFETAAWTAVPAVARVIAAMGPMLGIAPVDPDSPIVQAKMEIDVNPAGRRVSAN